MSLKHRILVFAHDAGGANLAMAYAYYQHINGYEVKCYPLGPAVKIFMNHIPELVFNDEIVFNDFDIVATGTSGIHSDYEMQIIKESKQKVYKTITFLDNTDEMSLRFSIKNQILDENFFPDEIWYENNNYSFDKYFYKDRVIYHENLYLKYLKDVFYKSKIKATNNNIVKFQGEYLLVLTEYISELFGDRFGFDEYDFLEYICEEVKSLDLNIPIFLKLHPAEKQDKFDKLIENYNLNIFKEDYNIQEVLYFSKLVFGLNSSVFKESLLLDKPTYSIQIGAKKYLDTINNVKVIKSKEELRSILNLKFEEV